MIPESCEETDPNIEYPFINEVKTEIRIGEYTYIDDETWDEYPYLNEVKTKTILFESTDFDEELDMFVTNYHSRIVEDVRGPNHIYEWIGSPDVIDEIGIPGQGEIDNPYSDFGSHHVTQIPETGKIYDPSYGGNPYNSFEEWEENSIAGFFEFIEEEIDGVKRWFYRIRKNTTANEITD